MFPRLSVGRLSVVSLVPGVSRCIFGPGPSVSIDHRPAVSNMVLIRVPLYLVDQSPDSHARISRKHYQTGLLTSVPCVHIRSEATAKTAVQPKHHSKHHNKVGVGQITGMSRSLKGSVKDRIRYAAKGPLSGGLLVPVWPPPPYMHLTLRARARARTSMRDRCIIRQASSIRT